MARVLLMHRRVRPLVVLLLASVLSTILVGTAAAGPTGAPGATAPTPTPPPRRSPNVVTAIGVGLSLGAVGFGVQRAAQHPIEAAPALVAPAAILVFAPTVARLYAGEAGGRHFLVRLGGFTTMALGASFIERFQGGSAPVDSLGVAIVGVGAAVLIGGTVSDLVTARDAAHRFNRRHELTVLPAVTSSSGRMAPGLSLSTRF